MGEVSILMNTFREMVNQDRTVIATVHQPSSDVFKLFDSLLLLSRGRVIYSGSVNHASTYFTQSPFQYNLATYNNPADFFADVSGGFVSDGKGEFVDSSILEHHFKQSEAYGRLRLRLKRLEVGTTPAAAGTTTNPLASRASDIESGSISMSSTPDLVVSIAADDDDDRKGMPIKTGGPKKPPSLSLLGLLLPFRELATIFSSFASMETALFKAYVLFYRSIFALSNRRQILVSSNFTHIGLAILFGWIMGDSSGQPGIYNTTAFFALSCMFLILTNIPIGFYMFNNHGVFLKESARELYPNLLKCLVADYPLYLLRAINAVLFFVVAWAMINQTVDPSKRLLASPLPHCPPCALTLSCRYLQLCDPLLHHLRADVRGNERVCDLLLRDQEELLRAHHRLGFLEHSVLRIAHQVLHLAYLDLPLGIVLFDGALVHARQLHQPL